VTKEVHNLLVGYNLTRTDGGLFALAGVEAVVAPDHTEETLLWAAKAVCALRGLCGQHLVDKDLRTPAAARRAIAFLSVLPALIYKRDRGNDLSELLFTTDLNVWSLQLHAAGDHVGSWLFDTLAEVLSFSAFTSKASDALRAFRVPLAAALETALLDACPEQRQLVAEHWPQQRRAWLFGVIEVPLSAPQADAISELVQTALHGLRWQQTRRKETNPELQKLAGKVSTKAAEVVNFLQELAEDAAKSLSSSRDADDPTEYLLRSARLELRALELQYRAGQCGNADVSVQCTEVCKLLEPIASRGSSLFTLIDESREEDPSSDELVACPLDLHVACRAVEALCRRADLELSAIAAKLGGRGEVAAMWTAAAEACALALIPDDETYN
jgi:hypothetical protein